MPAIGLMLFSVIAGSFALILPQPPATGTLRLDVTPADAAFTLDGMAMGWANGQEVLTGPHVIEITAAGYQSKRETVTIPAGAEQTMKVELERLPPPPTTGTLRLHATPADVVLALDGKAVGSANDFRQELPTGPHVVEISAAGYQSKSETVTIAAGAERPVEIALERLPAPPAVGTLRLDVSPADAAITLDGTAMGSANGFREELAAGTHVVEISAVGYQSRRETVTITAGVEQPMEIVLGRVPPPPSTGTLVLDGATPGAVLTLDGKQIGPAKDFRQELSPGTHVIAISAKGCEPTKQRVTIVAGDTLRIPLQLVRWTRKTRQWVEVEPCS